VSSIDVRLSHGDRVSPHNAFPSIRSSENGDARKSSLSIARVVGTWSWESVLILSRGRAPLRPEVPRPIEREIDVLDANLSLIEFAPTEKKINGDKGHDRESNENKREEQKAETGQVRCAW